MHARLVPGECCQPPQPKARRISPKRCQAQASGQVQEIRRHVCALPPAEVPVESTFDGGLTQSDSPSSLWLKVHVCRRLPMQCFKGWWDSSAPRQRPSHVPNFPLPAVAALHFVSAPPYVTMWLAGLTVMLRHLPPTSSAPLLALILISVEAWSLPGCLRGCPAPAPPGPRSGQARGAPVAQGAGRPCWVEWERLWDSRSGGWPRDVAMGPGTEPPLPLECNCVRGSRCRGAPGDAAVDQGPASPLTLLG